MARAYCPSLSCENESDHAPTGLCAECILGLARQAVDSCRPETGEEWAPAHDLALTVLSRLLARKDAALAVALELDRMERERSTAPTLVAFLGGRS